jgi:hypothetical protein
MRVPNEESCTADKLVDDDGCCGTMVPNSGIRTSIAMRTEPMLLTCIAFPMAFAEVLLVRQGDRGLVAANIDRTPPDAAISHGRLGYPIADAISEMLSHLSLPLKTKSPTLRDKHWRGPSSLEHAPARTPGALQPTLRNMRRVASVD